MIADQSRVNPEEQNSVRVLDTNFSPATNRFRQVGAAGLAFVSIGFLIMGLNTLTSRDESQQFNYGTTSGIDENPIDLKPLIRHLADPADREIGVAYMFASIAVALGAMGLYETAKNTK